MIELSYRNLTTNRLVTVLDERGTYDGPVQRTNVCGYLRVCREQGLVKTVIERKKNFHRHFLTTKGVEHLKKIREAANAV